MYTYKAAYISLYIRVEKHCGSFHKLKVKLYYYYYDDDNDDIN